MESEAFGNKTMLLQTDLSLDTALFITTAFYRQFSPLFPMSSRPIHIDSARVAGNDVEVIWAYFDRDTDGDEIVEGTRFTAKITLDFWRERQTGLLAAPICPRQRFAPVS
jgi:hypothetical protein